MSAHERRSRNKLAEDEDAAAGKLGPDFSEGSKCQPLSISEVKIALDQRLSNGWATIDNAVYKKTFDYVTTFSRFEHSETVAESVNAVREALVRDPKLTDFEATQLANLSPLEAEEAKALIPSLTMVPDDDLQTMLNAVAAVRNFS